MQERMHSPIAALRQMSDMIVGHLIYAAIDLGIADTLRDGPRTSAEIAALTSTQPGPIHRLMRSMAGFGLFRMDGAERFELTPLSEYLLSDHPSELSTIIRLTNHPINQQSWIALPHTLKTGETAFNHVFGMSVFDYYREHPEVGERFSQFLRHQFNQDVDAIAQAYPFADAQTFVDIGGGIGSLTIAILQAHPHLQGRIIDLEYTRAEAEAEIRAAGLAGRCEWQAGDFFADALPPADIYLLKHIIHDWDDQRGIAILSNCRRTMAPGSKLLLLESVFPSEAQPAISHIIMDLVMLAIYGGQERTQAEYEQLLERAGLRLTRTVPVSPSITILEAEPFAAET